VCIIVNTISNEMILFFCGSRVIIHMPLKVLGIDVQILSIKTSRFIYILTT